MSEQPNAEASRPRRKRVWRRVRRIGYLVVALVVLVPVGAFAVVNQAVDVPSPTEISARQPKSVRILYSDGTEMTTIAAGGANRESISGEVRDVVKYAVLAAEQPDYDSSSDVDLGSGIARQYLRMVTEGSGDTWRRRFTDLVTARKLSARYGKDLVLRGYLDTVYLGRTAHGFAAAARMYYGKDVRELTGTEAAMIAGLIRDPARSEDRAYATARWAAVVDTMADRGWITREYRDSLSFPAPLPVEATRIAPPEGARELLRNQVVRELEEVGFPLERAQRAGVVVRTTIDRRAQRAAEDAVDEVMAGQPDVLRQSLTAVDPTRGAVRAYWAGRDGAGLDHARDTLREPGTAFTPFALTAALQAGIGIGEPLDGTSPRTFGDRTVSNRGTASCGRQCSLRAASAQDIATVFYDLVLTRVGTRPVATAARSAGVPGSVTVSGISRELLVGADGTGAPDAAISIGAGATLVRPFDLAVAYGTFAAEGVHHEPYFVERVEAEGDQVLYQHADSATVAFGGDAAGSRAVAGNVTAALKDVPAAWQVGCAGRECAGKPGTVTLPGGEVAAAWMVGYTPSLSAAVWMGTDRGDVEIVDRAGAEVDGAGLPGRIWQRFMDEALEGAPVAEFPEPTPIGRFE
ncbi:transglycosylase domain-containing protein [Umezawaea sp.]|uniref:transglycosylase domain-containing protein n=1 Tax=Umezawaea sp. TaxID=1955258 RepID=UPI002ED2BA27